MGNASWITLAIVKIFGISIGVSRWYEGYDINILILSFIININTANDKTAGKKEFLEFQNRW